MKEYKNIDIISKLNECMNSNGLIFRSVGDSEMVTLEGP